MWTLILHSVFIKLFLKYDLIVNLHFCNYKYWLNFNNYGVLLFLSRISIKKYIILQLEIILKSLSTFKSHITLESSVSCFQTQTKQTHFYRYIYL